MKPCSSLPSNDPISNSSATATALPRNIGPTSGQICSNRSWTPGSIPKTNSPPTTDNRLREAGLSQEEVVGIRQRLTPLMHAYNFDSMLWDWIHLGLCDLLDAATGPLVKLVNPSLQATLGDPVALYAWAMEIAERHRVT